MAKRFTDTEKWADPWFRKLPPIAKLFWVYLCDSCDHAGVWKVDFELASFGIGEGLSEDSLKTLLGDRIDTHNPGYWFIRKFMLFQYGHKLNRGDAVHSAIARAESLGFKDSLESVIGGSLDPLMTPKAKAISVVSSSDVDVVVKEKGVVGEKEKARVFVKPTADEIAAYAASIGFVLDPTEFLDHYESNGWKVGRNPMKDWKATVRKWKHNQFFAVRGGKNVSNKNEHVRLQQTDPARISKYAE